MQQQMRSAHLYSCKFFVLDRRILTHSFLNPACCWQGTVPDRPGPPVKGRDAAND
jgi:hypothetical protein